MGLEILHSKFLLAVRALRFGSFEQATTEIRRHESDFPGTSEWALIAGNLQSADFAYWSLTALQHVESTGEWHLEAHHTREILCLCLRRAETLPTTGNLRFGMCLGLLFFFHFVIK